MHHVQNMKEEILGWNKTMNRIRKKQIEQEMIQNSICIMKEKNVFVPLTAWHLQGKRADDNDDVSAFLQ
jgi:hypothetical protein